MASAPLLGSPPDECLLSSPSPPRLPPFTFLPDLSIFQQSLSRSRALLFLSRPPPLELLLCLVYTFPPPPPVFKFQKIQIFILKTNSQDPDVLIPSDTDVSLVDRQCRVHREKQDSADTVENVTVIYGSVHKSSLGVHCIIETTDFSY